MEVQFYVSEQYFEMLISKHMFHIGRSESAYTRDHLFVRIHFGNGNRSGVTANMTISEFEKARSENDFHIVHNCDAIWSYQQPVKLLMDESRNFQYRRRTREGFGYSRSPSHYNRCWG